MSNSHKNIRNYKRMLRRKNKQIVVLLGAGAAMPWGGISSSQLKDLFIADTNYRTKDGTTIGKYLFDILDGFYGHDCSNFETFLAALETILNYILNATNTGGINEGNTSFTPAILKLKNEIEDLLVGKTIDEKRVYCGDLFRHFVNLVVDKIDEYNNSVLDDKFETINNRLIAFAKYFLNRNYSVKFYTTNYDNIVPQIFEEQFKVYEGFYKSSSIDKRFNFNLDAFRVARLSHFNIHGSIFLKHTMVGIQYETLYSSSAQHLLYALPINAGNPSERLLFSPIITGYNKTQRIVNKPFNFGFSAFTNDLNNCEGLLTVGYSFSDPHINCILSSFTHWNKTQFIHVTKCNGNFDNPNNREYAQLDYSVTSLYKEEENDTWFHDSSKRKHIYKQGFSNFLEETSNWITFLR